jgi:hypothetical protein
MLDISLQFGISFLVISCFTKLYIRTALLVATKKNGRDGWKSTHWIIPLDFLNGTLMKQEI